MQLAHRFLNVSQHGFIVQSALGVLKLSNMRLRRASVCVWISCKRAYETLE